MHAHSEADASDLTVIDNDQNLSQSSRLDGDACAQTDYLSPEAETCSSEDELPAMENLTLDDEADEADEDDDFVLFDLAGESLTSEPGNILDEAVKLARSASAEVGKSLEGLALDERLEQLQKKAFRLAAWENPARRTIGIVGDSAAGKSSLINSLLNIRNLAHKGDHGSAVTSFITEYHHRTKEHPSPFTVDAKFMNEAEIKQELHELLFNFRDYYRPGLNQELAEQDHEYREIERKSELALMTLESIFPGHPEVTEAFLLGPSAETIEERLQELASRLPWPKGSKQGHWVSGATTPAACHKKVAEFMNNGLWPLTYVVRIFLDAKVLETGLILADLPGLRDINIARIRRVEQFLFKCNQVFVVANINRAVTDQSVKAQICARGSKLQNLRNVCVVCTHADEIDLAASEKRWDKVTRLPATKAAKKEVNRARKENNAAALQLANIKYQNIYTKARNEDVSSKLKAMYKNEVGEIDVFCVGNRDYEGLEFWFPDAKLLAVQGSGVPELRRFCYGISERANMREAEQFVKVEVPDLLQSLRVWVEAAESDTSTPSIPENLIEQLRHILDRSANDVVIYLNDEFENQILQHWARRQHLFDQCATEASLNWESYHHTQYKAWVRNNGTHATRLKSARWNEEILEDMKETMGPNWDSLINNIESKLHSILSTIEQGIVTTEDKVKDVDESSPLRTMLFLKQQALSHQIREQWMILLQAIRTVRYHAMGDHFSSYVLTIMIPTYRACARENGPGMMARMHQIMATHMDRRDIFWHIYRRIDSECRNAFTAMDAALRASSANVCEELQRAFETANSGSVTTDGPGTRAEDVAAVRELVEAVQRKLDRVGYWEVTQPQDPDAGRPSAQCCQQALKT